MTSADDDMPAGVMHVRVSGGELADALMIWRGMAQDRFAADAQVYFDDGLLVIDSAGNSVAVSAEGEWPRVARVPMNFMLGLAKRPADGDSIRIRVEGDRFHVGPTSTECAVQPAREAGIIVQLDPPIRTLLKLSLANAPDQVERAGLARAVERAETQAAELIDRAARHLSKLGIERGEVVAFVRETILKNAQ